MFSSKSLAHKFLLLSFAASSAGFASAAPVVFSGFDASPAGAVPAGGGSQTARNSFFSALTTSVTERFEGPTFVAGSQPTAAIPQAVFGGTGSMFRSDGALGTTRIENRTSIGESPTGRFNTSPTVGSTPASQWWESSASFELTLTSTAQAFGFYSTDYGDFGGGLTIDLFNDGSAVASSIAVSKGSGGDGNLVFFGYADSEINFDRIVFNLRQFTPGNTDTFDFVGFDDLIIGNVNGTTPPPPTGVPEPGTLALAALSLGLLVAARRRRD